MKQMLNICVMELERFGFVNSWNPLCVYGYLCLVLNGADLCFDLELYALFQVQENDIWNDLDRHKLMEHVGSDSAINIYVKRKTMEIIGKVLESRTNPQGYTIPCWSLVFLVIRACSIDYHKSYFQNLYMYRFKEMKCPDVLAEHYKSFSCRLYQLISNNAILILPVCALVFHSKRQTFSAYILVSSINMLTFVDSVKIYSLWGAHYYSGKSVRGNIFQLELRSCTNR